MLSDWLTCYRYVELNPARAGMVAHPSGYPWSSHAFNALGKANDLVTPQVLHQALGSDEQARQIAYRALFKASIDEKEPQGDSRHDKPVMGIG